jgi:ketosteroid isomerase-like protein
MTERPEVPDDSAELWDALNRGDRADLARFVHEDATFSADTEVAIPGEFHGVDGFLALWSEWREAFEDFHVEVDELVEAGPDRGMAVIRQRGLGRGSGVDIAGTYYYTGWWRDGKLIRGSFFSHREEAEQALREDG